jgi:hypothetical protein
MIAPAHIGIEHPSLVWLAVVGIAAFAVGLGIARYRSLTAGTNRTPPTAGDGERR